MTTVSTVTIVVAKSGAADAVEQVLATVVDGSRDPSGRTRFSSRRGLEDPNLFVATEEWDSQESVQAHLSCPNLALILDETRSLLALPPQTIYVGGP